MRLVIVIVVVNRYLSYLLGSSDCLGHGLELIDTRLHRFHHAHSDLYWVSVGAVLEAGKALRGY